MASTLLGKILKSDRKSEVKVHKGRGGRRGWAASLKGEDDQYGFDREFKDPVSSDFSSSGKSGTANFEIEEGEIMEVESNRNAAPRRVFTRENKEVREISKGEAKDKLHLRGKREKAEDIMESRSRRARRTDRMHAAPIADSFDEWKADPSHSDLPGVDSLGSGDSLDDLI